MEWADDAIVLSLRAHGESSGILEALTRGHGRHLGLVRGGSSSKGPAVLQPGHRVSAGCGGAWLLLRIWGAGRQRERAMISSMPRGVGGGGFGARGATPIAPAPCPCRRPCSGGGGPPRGPPIFTPVSN